MIIIDNAVNIRLGCTMPYNPPEPPEPPEPLYWCDWCEEPIFRGDMCRRLKTNGGTGGLKMTDREKAVVMAYTGIAMLTGEKIQVFYEYLKELYGRPVFTHEISRLDIQKKSRDDFIELCRNDEVEADND